MINAANPNMSKRFMPYHIIIYAKGINYTQKKSTFSHSNHETLYDIHCMNSPLNEPALFVFPHAMS